MTEPNGLVDGIIKKDSRGRLRITVERREALLAEFDQSAMSGRQFAAWAGIKHSTFTNWLVVRRKGQGQPSGTEAKGKAGVRWLEAVVAKPSSGQESGRGKTAGIVLEKPGGIRIEISDARQVSVAVQLLRELKRPC